MSLNYEIGMAFSATQIILVFLSVLFGIRYQQITDLLSEDPFETDKLESLESKLDKYLIEICGVMLVINIAISLLFSPLLIQVFIGALNNITTNLTFNFTQTSYFVITLMIYGLTLWSGILTKRVYIRKKEVHNKIDERKSNMNEK